MPSNKRVHVVALGLMEAHPMELLLDLVVDHQTVMVLQYIIQMNLSNITIITITVMIKIPAHNAAKATVKPSTPKPIKTPLKDT